MNLVIKDAVRQILGRLASAIGGFLVIKMITPYLWPLRFGDYSTILKYFAIWSAFADFGLYVIAMKRLWEIKKSIPEGWSIDVLKTYYNKFVSSRVFMIACVYITALIVSYMIPSYTSNPYLVRGLPLGMIFSASFMTAGILQIPLQLFWQMKHLSIWLILARIVQIAVLCVGIYRLYAWVDFNSTADVTPHIFAFNCVLISVVASGVTQWLYVYLIGKKYLPLRWNWDWDFTKELLGANWQYGLAYYLSSMHTLIVLILLSIFYPTSEWYVYVGLFGLALSLIEILLIVPSALGNSLMHDIWAVSTQVKRQRFGALMLLVILFWLVVIVNFVLFAPHIIQFLGGSDYLTTTSQVWSDYILPFLGIVITLSFVKQVFNYLFVSTDLHNNLLWINLTWVVFGVWLWVPALLRYGLEWAIFAQILLEVLFVLWALVVAWRHQVIPDMSSVSIGSILGAIAWLVILSAITYTQLSLEIWWYMWIWAAILFNFVLAGALFPLGKRVMKGL